MIQGLDWWYDKQMPRFLEQIVRGFSGFQYQTGWRDLPDGTRQPPQLRMVPCTIAQTDRLVGHVMRNNSENTILTVPRITIQQTGLQLRRADLQHPGHVDTRQVFEREIDTTTGKYLESRGERAGRSYTVMRMMPRPFEMTIQVDLWTATLDQKYQLAEQILTVVAPDFAIQNSDNALDWSAMTYMELTDVQWSTRSVPVGTEDDIDIMSLTFRLPFLLNPPAKVMQQKVIEQIVTNVHEGRASLGEEPTDENFMFQHITTPGDHCIQVSRDSITLLGAEGSLHDQDGQTFGWRKLLNLYGTLRPTLSKIRLKMDPEQIDDWSYDIIGTLQYDQANENKLIWTIDPDTLPANTQAPVDAIIHPINSYPGKGLPGNETGQRYLITNDIAGPSQAWGDLRAHANDIIEYVRIAGIGRWVVSHTPVRGDKSPNFVLNLYSGSQLRWNGEDWVLTIDGVYAPGYWRLSL